MLENVTFDTVTAVVTGNTYGFTTDVSQPATMTSPLGPTPCPSLCGQHLGDVPASTIDQAFPLTLEIYGR